MKHFLLPIALAAFTFFPITAKADNLTATKAEAQEFRLSTAKVKSMAGAYSNVIDLVGSDPKLAAAWKSSWQTLKDDEHSSGRDRISATVLKMVGMDGRITTAFSKAGTTPKEAGMTMEAMVGSMIGMALAQSSRKGADLPAGAVRDNVTFAQSHQQEIKAAMEQIGATMSKYPNLKMQDSEGDDPPDQQ